MGILQKNYKYNNISQFIFEGGFTLLLIVYLTRLYLDTTMWYLGWSDRNSMLFALLAGFCVLLKCIFYDIWTIKEALAGIAIVFICGMVYHHTGYVDVLHFCVLVIGCKGVSDKTIVRLYFYVNMYLLCLTTIAMFIGIVPELIYYKDWEYIRRSFGSIYPTDLAAHIFFLIMAYSYIKKDQLRYLHLITFLLMAVVSYMLCRTETSTICIIVFTLLLFHYKMIRDHGDEVINNSTNLLLKIGGTAALPFMAVFSIWATINYQKYEVLTKLNELISSRLGLGLNAVNSFGFQRWGSFFEMIGNGRSEALAGTYNFVDNSYLYILVRYGYFALIILLLIGIVIIYKANRRGKYLISIILAAAALHGFMEHHLLEPSYMFVPLLLFSDMDKPFGFPLNVEKRLARLEHNITAISVLSLSLSAALYAFMIGGFGSRYFAVYLIITAGMALAYGLYAIQKISGRELLMYFFLGGIVFIACGGFSADEGFIELFKLDVNERHKITFLLVISFSLFLPLLCTLLASIGRGRKAIAASCVVLLAGAIFTLAKGMRAIENVRMEAQPIVDNINYVRASFPDIEVNFYTDRDAFICTEETDMTIKQGQPDRRSGNIVYYVNSGEQRVKLTETGQFVYKELNDKTGYYTNVEGLKN